MTNDQELLDAAQKAVQVAMAAGAEWADAVAAAGHSTSVTFERNSIRENATGAGQGVGVRVFVRGGRGLAHSDSLEPRAVEEVARQAVELARSATPDPDFKRLPEPQEVPPQPEMFEEAIAGMPVHRLVEMCVKAIEQGRDAGSKKVFMSGRASVGWGYSAIASCTGIALTALGSQISVGVSASVWANGEAAQYGDGAAARRLADLKWDHIPAEVVETAESLLGDRPVSTGARDLVLDYESAYWWLAGVVGAANAESVQRNRSYMAGKEGEKIASDLVTVMEDPLVPGGISSQAFDGEGVPKRKRKLIDRGVLTTYLHNSYTAGKAGVEPTGHARRSGSMADVGIGTSNLLVEPGDKPLQELIAEVKDGIFVVMGAPMADRVTGQVSSTIDAGFIISDGQLGHPVKGAMMAGHIFDFLGRIDAVSSDYREEPGQIMPALRLRDVLVSAQ